MMAMLRKVLKKLALRNPSDTKPVSPPPSTPEPDSGVITAMIKPEPGAILGGRRKPSR
jgi:hypothetical protein